MSTVPALVTNSAQWVNQIRAALALPHSNSQRLYFNGREFKWMTKPTNDLKPVAIPGHLISEAMEDSVCAA